MKQASKISASGAKHSRAKAWFEHHKFCLRNAWRRQCNVISRSLATWFVIGFSLVLPTLFYTLAVQLEPLLEQRPVPQLSIYVSNTTPIEGVREMGDQISEDRLVEVRIISPEHALELLEDGLDLQGVIEQNPLPYTIVVTGDASHLRGLYDEYQAAENVEAIQLDEEWIERWAWLVTIGERAFATISIILLFGAIGTVGNTVGLTIVTRRNEIEVMTLVGATASFIRRPFIYHGVISGLIGALIALIVQCLLVISLYSPWQQLLHSYQIPSVDIPVIVWAFPPAMGLAIGAAGAFFACSRYINFKDFTVNHC